MARKGKGMGWFFESRRHKLSALGIKTGRKSPLKKEVINTLQGNPMFFPQSAKPVLQVAEIKYQPTFDDWLKAHYGVTLKQVNLMSKGHREGLLEEYQEAVRLSAKPSKKIVSETERVIKLNYTATKLRMDGKTLDPAKLSQVSRDLEENLRKAGYKVFIDTTEGKITFSDFRLITDVTGYNLSPYTQRRGNILNWDDWVKVNKIVNEQLDKSNISANVSSLGGKFVIREGKEAKTEEDWEHLADENIGSQVRPVARRDAWQREMGYPKGKVDIVDERIVGDKRIIVMQDESNLMRTVILDKVQEKQFNRNVQQDVKKLWKIAERKDMGYTPKYQAGDVSKVATDIAVGTGAEVGKHAPLIALVKVRQFAKKKLKDDKMLTKRQEKSLKKHSKHHTQAHIREMRKQMKKGRTFSQAHKSAIGKGLNYPKDIRSKYPAVTKEIERLSKKHNLKKPLLKYGKNPRLATFTPPNTIKLSTRLMKETLPKKRDVAQHEFKHYDDIQKTAIRDVSKLEKRATIFEEVTK